MGKSSFHSHALIPHQDLLIVPRELRYMSMDLYCYHLYLGEASIPLGSYRSPLPPSQSHAIPVPCSLVADGSCFHVIMSLSCLDSHQVWLAHEVQLLWLALAPSLALLWNFTSSTTWNYL